MALGQRAEEPRRRLLLARPRRSQSRFRGGAGSDRRGRDLRHPRADRPPQALGHGQLGRRGEASRRDRRRPAAAASASIAISTRIPPAAIRCATCCRRGCRKAAWRRCCNGSASLPCGSASARRSPPTASTISAGSRRGMPCASRFHRISRSSPAAPSAISPARARADPLDAVCDYLIADRGHTRIVVDVHVGRGRPGNRPLGKTCWWAPTAPRSRPTARPARASRTRASTAPSRACSGVTSGTWDCCRCRRASTR